MKTEPQVEPLRIVVIDDHPAMRAGLAALIDDASGLEMVGDAGTGAEALILVPRLQPDVTLIDLQLPDMDGETVILRLLELNPEAVIIAVTTFGGSDTIKRTLAAGARGFLLKETARLEIVEAIRRAHKGQRVVRGEVAERLAEALSQEEMTPRELDVLKTLAMGSSNKHIASELGISESTVKVHLSNILQKLSASDRTEAVMKALGRGIIRLR
jgi:DNA-binding NarL/FixJ family response regulator